MNKSSLSAVVGVIFLLTVPYPVVAIQTQGPLSLPEFQINSSSLKTDLESKLRVVNEDSLLADSLVNAGLSQAFQQNYRLADEYFRQALIAISRTGDRNKKADVLYELAIINEQSGKFVEYEAALHEAQKLALDPNLKAKIEHKLNQASYHRRRFENIRSPLLTQSESRKAGAVPQPRQKAMNPGAELSRQNEAAFSANSINVDDSNSHARADSLFFTEQNEYVPDIRLQDEVPNNMIPWDALAVETNQDEENPVHPPARLPADEIQIKEAPQQSHINPGMLPVLTTILFVLAGTALLMLVFPGIRARLYFLFGGYKKTISICEKLLEKKPQRINLYPMLAYACFSADVDRKNACKTYEKILKLKIDFTRKDKSSNIFAAHDLKQDQIDELGIEMLESALENELEEKSYHSKIAA
jgi:tetratricopeptide (TPR) repeat protein